MEHRWRRRTRNGRVITLKASVDFQLDNYLSRVDPYFFLYGFLLIRSLSLSLSLSFLPTYVADIKHL